MSGVSDGVRGALSLQHGKLSQICCYHIKELKIVQAPHCI